MALAVPPREDARLPSFVNAVLWLARHAKLAVAVLLNTELANHPALDQILYKPFVYAELLTAPRACTTGIDIIVEANRPASAVWLWLGAGRTHAFSPAEAKLARALLNDAELSPLFSANQSVETIFKNRPTVDLLWADGRVVVEVDGDDHREPQKFAADRRRDFELLISGYSVLRLINNEVTTDTDRALAQIREVVRYRKRTCPDLERLI